MTAFQFIKSIGHVPMQINGNKAVKASNSEIRRWLMNRSILINGERPHPDEPVEFPVKQLIFFPTSPRRCTMQDNP